MNIIIAIKLLIRFILENLCRYLDKCFDKALIKWTLVRNTFDCKISAAFLCPDFMPCNIVNRNGLWKIVVSDYEW